MAVKGTNISRENLAILDKYVKEVSRGRSHIPKEIEKELIEQYREGKPTEKAKALDMLVSYNITIFADIAISVLNTIRGGDRVDPLDLMQVAVITYMKKLETWDSTRKSKMITYYYREARTQMQRFVMSNAFQIKQGSVFLQHLAYTLSKLRIRWLGEHEHEPSVSDMAKETGVSETTIKSCLKATNLNIMSMSDAPVLAKMQYPYLSSSPILDMLEKTMNKVNLDEKEKNIVYAYLDKKEDLTESVTFKLGVYDKFR
jgi:DNA-directed RNA polymerase specialized sigma subunit